MCSRACTVKSDNQGERLRITKNGFMSAWPELQATPFNKGAAGGGARRAVLGALPRLSPTFRPHLFLFFFKIGERARALPYAPQVYVSRAVLLLCPAAAHLSLQTLNCALRECREAQIALPARRWCGLPRRCTPRPPPRQPYARAAGDHRDRAPAARLGARLLSACSHSWRGGGCGRSSRGRPGRALLDGRRVPGRAAARRPASWRGD